MEEFFIDGSRYGDCLHRSSNKNIVPRHVGVSGMVKNCIRHKFKK